MTVKIYKLIDPFTSEIRYIGKTSRSLKKRLWEHINEAKYDSKEKSHKKNWIRQVLDNGGKPEIELIVEVDESKWEQAEIDQIAIHKIKHPITNIASGGTDGGRVNKRKVAKMDYLTLEILKTYDSIEAAEQEERMRYTRIIDGCSGRKLVVNGYLWRYIGDDGLPVHPVIKSSKRKIGQFDLCMNLIRIYPNLESTNEDAGAISGACLGKLKTIRGHIWRYLDLYNNTVEPTIAYKHKTVSKMDLNGNVISIYENAKKACEAHNAMNETSIIQCCKQDGRIYKGFKWKYNPY
jgi:hypothetical protein